MDLTNIIKYIKEYINDTIITSELYYKLKCLSQRRLTACLSREI